MGAANTWVVLKNSSRPTLRDEDQDRKNSVSNGLETKTAVSRTTRLVSVTVTVIDFQFLCLYLLDIFHKICISA